MAVAAVLGSAAAAPAHASVRRFWIAAEPVTWNVVPNGRDAIMGDKFATADTLFPTVVYRRYTAGWKRPRSNSTPASQPKTTIPGPLLQARVGDRIIVHFKNM